MRYASRQYGRLRMTKLDWVAIFAGINIVLLVVLAFRVSGARRKHKVSLGDGGNAAVLQAVRAHGNAAETIPVALVALFLLAALEPVPVVAIQALGGTVTLGRLAHAIGLSTDSGPSPGRVLGTALTWLSLLAAGGLLIWAGAAPLL